MALPALDALRAFLAGHHSLRVLEQLRSLQETLLEDGGL